MFKQIQQFIWPPDRSLRFRRLGLLVFAAVLALSYPPFPFGFLAGIALIYPIDIASHFRFTGAFKATYFFSFFFHLFLMYWIALVTIPGMITAMAIISLYTAFIFGLFGEMWQRSKAWAMILLPFLWVGMEYFRTLLEIAFPWSNLSYSQVYYLPLIQISEYVGDLGISFLIIVVNLIGWRIWRTRSNARRAVLFVVLGLLIVAPIIQGSLSLDEHSFDKGRKVTVAMLQGDVPLDVKWATNNRFYSFRLYDSLAKAAPPADLIVWPETAAPAYLFSRSDLTYLVSKTARDVGEPMLVGTLDYTTNADGSYDYYNAAVQCDSDGRFRPVYHKNKLVPFGETFPYGIYVPYIAELPFGWSDFEHGRELRVYKNQFGNYGTLICYEIAFPEMISRYVNDGADFLVNITNDTWFGVTAGPFQHAEMAVYRAIENRIPIARCANSGFTFFVDQYGQISDCSRLYEKTIVTGSLVLSGKRTVFNRLGPLVGIIGLILIGIVSILLVGLRLRERLKN